MRTSPDTATCMYYTGIDPFTKKPVTVAKGMRNRKLQRTLMQFFKPKIYFEVREALVKAARSDLIGGCEGLITANPPREAIEARRRQANAALKGDHYHTVANPAKGEEAGSGDSTRAIDREEVGKAEEEEQWWPKPTAVARNGPFAD
jgi:hypothetical protein